MPCWAGSGAGAAGGVGAPSSRQRGALGLVPAPGSAPVALLQVQVSGVEGGQIVMPGRLQTPLAAARALRRAGPLSARLPTAPQCASSPGTPCCSRRLRGRLHMPSG